MKTRNSSPLSLALLLSSLVLLPACSPINWIKERFMDTAGTPASCDVVGTSDDGSGVLVTINGKPLMTVAQFEKEFNNFISKHPLGQMLASMEGIDKQILNGLVSQKLISKYVQDHKMDQDPEYKEQLAQLKAMLDARRFEQLHQVALSEADLRSFYEQNKDKMPEVLVSRGGANVIGASFDNDIVAKAFLDKVRGKGKEFAKIAKESGVADANVKDFKVVNATSVGVDEAIRNTVTSVQKVPAYETVKAGNKTWVLFVSGKEDLKYRPFEEVKAIVEERANGEKMREVFEKAVEGLKSEYNVATDDSYFAKKAQSRPAPVLDQEQLQAVMPQEAAQNAAPAQGAARTA